jgi:hypothetical protein
VVAGVTFGGVPTCAADDGYCPADPSCEERSGRTGVTGAAGSVAESVWARRARPRRRSGRRRSRTTPPAAVAARRFVRRAGTAACRTVADGERSPRPAERSAQQVLVIRFL